MRRHTLFTLACLILPVAVLAQSSKPVAVVNGEPITRAELDGVLKLRPSAVTPLTTAQNRQIAEQVLTALVEETLLRQFLAKSTPPVAPAEIDRQFESLQASLKSQNRTLADYCRETQQTEKQVRAGIESMQRWQSYLSKHLPEEELKKFYAENKEFFDRVTVRCSHIVYRVTGGASPAERANAAAKMRELRGQIVGGKLTFAEAAQKFSHCPSATKGGDLGYIARKWMVEEPFAKAAFALKPGEVSDVVVTDLGVHLILAVDRKPGDASDFAKIRDDVRECAAEELRQTVISELRKTAKIEVNLP